jgi:type II secretory pathway component PulF
MFDNFLLKFQFNAVNRERFYRKLAQLLKNGVSVDRALKQLGAVEQKRRHYTLAKMMRRWQNDIQNGQSFGLCIRPFVPPSESLLLETGSQSGKLYDALRNVIDVVSQQRRISSTIKKASAYPAVLVLMLVGALLTTAYKIIPTFTEILPIEQWSGPPLFVANVSFFIQDYGFAILIGFITTAVLMSLSLPRWTGPTRLWVEKMPPWSIYRVWQGSAFLLSLASMMTAGVKIDEKSLKQIAGRSSPYLRERARAISQRIAGGQNLGEAMASTGHGFPDEELIDDFRIYASLKGFDQNVINVTKEWVSEVEQQIESAMRLVNGAVLVLIAVTIGTILMSLFGIVQQIQDSSSI